MSSIGSQTGTVRLGEEPNRGLLTHVKEIGEQSAAGKQPDVKGGQGTDKGGETVMVAEGLGPIPRKVVQKIQSEEYVDLEELLKFPHHQGEVPLPQRQKGVVVIQSVESLKKCKPRITVFPQWVEAFAIYVAVLSKTRPQCVPDMMAYMVLIKEANTHGGARWLSYDREFRERVAAKKLLQWGERDPNLWAKFFAGSTPAARVCRCCGSHDHGTAECTYADRRENYGRQNLGSMGNQPRMASLPMGAKPRGIKKRGACYPYNNKGAWDRAPPCPFQHECSNCGEGHPARVCPYPIRKAPRPDFNAQY